MADRPVVSNLLWRSGRVVARLVGLGLFLALSGALVAVLVDWTPGFAATTTLHDVTDYLVTDQILAFDQPPSAGTDEGPLHPADLSPQPEERIDTFGDDPVLDQWWTECAEGSGYACDRLFAEAPVGSAYEEFGLTCGDRPELIQCQGELDGRHGGPVVEGWPVPFDLD